MIRHVILYTCVLSLLIGCRSYNRSSATEGFKITETITMTPFEPIKQTIIPSARVVSTMASPLPADITSSQLFTSTVTPDLVPTMTAEMQESLETLIETNGNCLLPCWWGIIPGKTSWQEVDAYFHELGIERISTKVLESGEIHHGLGGLDFQNLSILHRFSFLEKNSIVSEILLDIQGQKDPEKFTSVWKRYSPIELLRVYGQPTRVWLRTSADKPGVSNSRHGYELWIVYWLAHDQPRFIIQYNGFLEEDGESLIICPRFENGIDIQSMKVLIQSANEYTPLEEKLDVWREDMNYSKRIQEASGIDEARFYALFMQTDLPACVTTPISIWPEIW